MKTKGKPWQFFVVAVLIVVFAFTAFLGISTQYGDTTKIWVKGAQDIRFGIDIRGGVDVTFMPADGYDATDEQMAAAESVIQQRLVNLNITDNEVYTDYNKDRIIVRFPWKEGETDFNPESAIQEIGATAVLTFREGKEVDSEGKPTGVTAENIILEGKDIKRDRCRGQQCEQRYIRPVLCFAGTQRFRQRELCRGHHAPFGVQGNHLYLDGRHDDLLSHR